MDLICKLIQNVLETGLRHSAANLRDIMCSVPEHTTALCFIITMK